MDHYTVSVKTLIETVIVKGDIDNRYVKKSRAVLGTKIHQMLQKTISCGRSYGSCR